jgi:hypothetical protein
MYLQYAWLTGTCEYVLYKEDCAMMPVGGSQSDFGQGLVFAILKGTTSLSKKTSILDFG